MVCDFRATEDTASFSHCLGTAFSGSSQSSCHEDTEASLLRVPWGKGLKPTARNNVLAVWVSHLASGFSSPSQAFRWLRPLLPSLHPPQRLQARFCFLSWMRMHCSLFSLKEDTVSWILSIYVNRLLGRNPGRSWKLMFKLGKKREIVPLWNVLA